MDVREIVAIKGRTTTTHTQAFSKIYYLHIKKRKKDTHTHSHTTNVQNYTKVYLCVLTNHTHTQMLLYTSRPHNFTYLLSFFYYPVVLYDMPHFVSSIASLCHSSGCCVLLIRRTSFNLKVQHLLLPSSLCVNVVGCRLHPV